MNTAKAVAFHLVFEWVPIFLIAANNFNGFSFLPTLVAYYVAFISIYELGYLLNDQLALRQLNGRTRARPFDGMEILVFVAIRIGVFLMVTLYVADLSGGKWWIWNFLLVLVFVIHNFLRQAGLKIITFSYLAFVRFFSPIIVLVPGVLDISIVLPVMLHYVLFRLITYMDSKEFIKNFDRQTNHFRVGYHLFASVFSICLAVFANSFIPIWISTYYIVISAGFVVIAPLVSKWT